MLTGNVDYIIKYMRMYLINHDYKYASEQMLLTVFPSERPEYPQGKPEGDRLEISLSKDCGSFVSRCLLVREGKEWSGEDSAVIAETAGELEKDRVCQRLIKNAIYRATLSSGVKRPPWGALTGVRPGKLLCRMLEDGMSREEAEKAFVREYDVSPVRATLCAQTAGYTLAAAESLKEKDICLYVGIPFCPTRCAYCSFVSQSVEKSMKLIAPFMDALLKEVHATAVQINSLGLRPVSVYMGGGTPTTLSAEQLETLCSALEREFDLSAVREYTVEAGRPDTITREKLEVLKRHGVDRVSVNPQTMSDAVLEVIGRKHSSADIVSALNKVRQTGGFSVNMDLIAGLPSDSMAGFENTLGRVIELSPENITVHTLSMKKGSRLTLEDAPVPSGEEVSQMLDKSRQLLTAAGYKPYYLYRQKFMSGGFENVGWTKSGKENLYNICIMEELCSIIAMGGGGSTKLVKPGDARNIRIMAPKYPLEYIEHIEHTCEEKTKISEYYEKES